MHTRALLPFLVDVLCDTDLCALNLPKGIGIARFRRRAAEARDVVSYPRPPPTGATRTRDIFDREVKRGRGRLTHRSPTRAGGRAARPDIHGRLLPGEEVASRCRVSDPTLRSSPSSMALQAPPSWAESCRPGGELEPEGGEVASTSTTTTATTMIIWSIVQRRDVRWRERFPETAAAATNRTPLKILCSFPRNWRAYKSNLESLKNESYVSRKAYNKHV